MFKLNQTPISHLPSFLQGLLNVTLGLTFLLSMTSCLSYKQIVNFQDGQDLGPGKADSIANQHPVRLQTDDVVMINVTSFNLEEANRFNVIPNMQVGQMQQLSGNTVNEPFGYRVNQNGQIELPVIGNVFVRGLTLDSLHDVVLGKVKATGYLKDPAVQVRYLNFRVTVLGEVNAPGTFTISTPKINVLEAIGLANDLTLFSKRNTILVIREQNGQRQYGRINVMSKEIFNSPYYYLQPNDVVYVEPHKSKIMAAPDPASRYVGAFTGIATLVTLILTLFR